MTKESFNVNGSFEHKKPDTGYSPCVRKHLTCWKQEMFDFSVTDDSIIEQLSDHC